jgi:hypothetical protein
MSVVTDFESTSSRPRDAVFTEQLPTSRVQARQVHRDCHRLSVFRCEGYCAQVLAAFVAKEVLVLGHAAALSVQLLPNLDSASCVTAEDGRSEATRALNVRIEYRHSIRSAMTVSARADTAPPLLRTGHPPLKRGGSVQWLPIFPVQCLSGGSDKGE